jgi:ABC-type antimicrobial peptide transport system permease subunit
MKALPFTYATRHLIRDIPRFFQKISGSAIVIFLIIAAGTFNEGMDALLNSSSSPKNVILLSAGSEESIERSEISVQVESLASAGIRNIEQKLNTPAVSGEIHYMGSIKTVNSEQKQGMLRGITPTAFMVHDQIRIIEGDFPRSGEVLVGKQAYHGLKLPQSELETGSEIIFENTTFRVSGIFEAPSTIMESEIWFDRHDLMSLTQRETLSCVIIKMKSVDDFIYADLFSKQRLDLELTAISSSDYYAKLSNFYSPIRAMIWLTACLIGIGAVFGGLNMLYAALAERIREIATLQAIGFSRAAILISLIQESLLSTMIGTLIAMTVSVFLLQNITISFSLGTFPITISEGMIMIAFITGILLGIIGTIAPAMRCLYRPLPAALKS